jgi:Family of unknown function (DUF5681)
MWRPAGRFSRDRKLIRPPSQTSSARELPMSDDAHGYRVGRGRPPRETQFKKGISGNPSGRPKRVPSFRSDLVSELRRKIDVVEGGKKQRLTKQQALIRTLTSAAIENDARAVSALLSCLKFFGVGADESPPETIDADDLEILNNYIERQRAPFTGSEKESKS